MAQTIATTIERLLGMAAVDAQFAELLLADRAQALAASGLELSASERSILLAVSEQQLRQMIAGVAATLPEPTRRVFLKHAQLALLALAGGSLLGLGEGCAKRDPEPAFHREERKDQGGRGKLVRAVQDVLDRVHPEPFRVGGIRPDLSSGGLKLGQYVPHVQLTAVESPFGESFLNDVKLLIEPSRLAIDSLMIRGPEGRRSIAGGEFVAKIEVNRYGKAVAVEVKTAQQHLEPFRGDVRRILMGQSFPRMLRPNEEYRLTCTFTFTPKRT